jgi:hypothetical protein
MTGATPEPLPDSPFLFDVDRLERLLSADGRRYLMGPPLRREVADDDPSRTHSAVELVLYVSTGSPACAKAMATLRGLRLEFPPDQIRLTVRDVAQHIEAATRDRILFTPTLLCGAREPYVRVLGDLTNRSVLLDLLETAKLDQA